MHIILLKFSANKSKAAELMAAHNAWLQAGFDDGVFILAGSVQPQLGGMLLAQGGTRAEIEQRVSEDPFVKEGVVTPEILEITLNKADERMSFLMA